MFYSKNLPVWERLLRMGAAIVLGVFALTVIHGIWVWLLLAVAGILVFTGLVGFCPACALAGRRLAKRD
jgi:hypothetical protein